MARTKDTTLTERNRRICLLRRNGFTYSEIAQMEDLSRVRVAQIVAETMPELDEDEGRAEIASILEFAEKKAVELISNPGWKFRPDGRPAEGPDGTPAVDQQVANEALKTLIIVADRKSKLYGWDRPQKRSLTIEIPEAQRQMQEAVEAERRMVAEARKAGVLQGQVVRELPSGQEPA